jgi:hypothetical protein
MLPYFQTNTKKVAIPSQKESLEKENLEKPGHPPFMENLDIHHSLSSP